MSGKEQTPFRKITSLDLQAKELGIGGNLSPETDERLYKIRMQKRKDVQSSESCGKLDILAKMHHGWIRNAGYGCPACFVLLPV